MSTDSMDPVTFVEPILSTLNGCDSNEPLLPVVCLRFTRLLLLRGEREQFESIELGLYRLSYDIVPYILVTRFLLSAYGNSLQFIV